MRYVFIVAVSAALVASASFAQGAGTYKKSTGFRFAAPNNGFFRSPAKKTTRPKTTVSRDNTNRPGIIGWGSTR